MRIKQSRHGGVLMHISSLPSPHGIGDLGREAYAMADMLHEAGFDRWQILPIGPTGYGNSPYAARSTFAGNELFIDLRPLARLQLIDTRSLSSLAEEFSSLDPETVDYDKVIKRKLPMLKSAARTFHSSMDSSPLRKEFHTFCASEDYWLSDYALFMSLFEEFRDGRWFSHWPKRYGNRESEDLLTYHQEHVKEIEIWRILQFFFHIQWREFRSYVNSLGIKLIGDIPIFVASDSVDTWSNLHMFKTDTDGRFSAVSGVPPDFFSSTGQLWGNPVYDWSVCKSQDYQWWIRRLTRTLQFVDIIRIDHFRGFDAYWEVPAGSPTAENGKWVEAPGKDFFETIRRMMGSIPIIAEDLGVVTPSVEQLRDSNGFPGMKIFQFGFVLEKDGKLDAHEEFLPHNYHASCVAYTGTHDNDTTSGWFNSIPGNVQKAVCRYLDCKPEDVVKKMVRALFASHAQDAIVPLQDLFELGSDARMNTPSTCGPKNWSWRLDPRIIDSFPTGQIRDMLHLFGRYPLNTL